jgi:hypothetical protein
MEKEMKTKSKIIAYIIHSIAAAVVVLSAQISLADKRDLAVPNPAVSGFPSWR